MVARQPIGFTIAICLLAVPGGAEAARQRFTVPGGTLLSALTSFARQAGIDIAFGSELGAIPSPGLNASMEVRAGLEHLLANTPYAVRMVGPDSYRVVRRLLPPPALPVRAARTIDTGGGDIVVTGSKRPVTLASYPGSATIIVPGEDGTTPYGSGGQVYMLRRTPILQSTELGRGRNKLFIRGVADSSFTGPTQATAGTYFGDVRIGYSGPDPSLNLFDVERVEILEGPQGALYGAGSIGGVIRLVPRPPLLTGTEAAVEAGISSTAHGAPGYDTAAMINFAPWRDHAAVRVIAYRNVTGGYIDDPGRRLRNLNRLTETGGRMSTRIESGDGWTVIAGGILQKSRQPDLQYATIGVGPLERVSSIPQPFSDDYKLGRLVITRDWDSGLRLFSATGRVVHDTWQRFDASRPTFVRPVAYDELNTMRLTTQEVRLSRTLPGGESWLIGASLVKDRTAKAREYGFLGTQRDLIGVTNRTKEQAVFATTTQNLGRMLSITAGGRYTKARMDGDPSTTSNSPFIRGQTSKRFDPQLGLLARLTPRLAAFAQYQQGFRTGGLAVAPGIGRVATFTNDTIRVGEAGLRLVRQGPTGLSAVLAGSYAYWNNIQADLVSQFGFPYTANVGDGRITALEGSADWVPIAALRLRGAVFLNRSRLVDPQPTFASSGRRPLPATPSLSATAGVSFKTKLAGAPLLLDGNARYVGRSRVGVGPVLDLPYGDYAELNGAATLQLEALALTFSVENLLDTRGNRFAIGNPFGVVARDERTPLRPRTVRVGGRIAF